MKKLAPEEIARKIQRFDQELCTQVFLSQLKPLLPSPEQIGKLNVYANADPEELAGLHPSDRLMVKLIQIKRLGPRIEGMLYKCNFNETWLLLDEVSLVSVSCCARRRAYVLGCQEAGRCGKGLVERQGI